MVYFSCSGCNESLKKNKVINHLNFCRRCTSLTCLDCQQDFSPQTYSSHNSCMTEVEKYGGPGYALPANANKGQKKQIGWMDTVRANVKNFIDETKNEKNKKNEQILLTGLLQYDNIPRKKAKFANFVKSSFGRFRYNEPLIEQAWEIVSAVNAEPVDDTKEEESSGEPKKNGSDLPKPAETAEEVEEKPKKKSKRKHEEMIESEELLIEEENAHHKKKKRKKEKQKEEEENEAQVDETPDDGEENSHQKKKKKKKGKRVDEENEVENGHEDTQSKKKSKKRHRDDEVEDNEEQVEEIPKKKRNKTEYAPEGFEQQRLNETLEEEAPKKFVIADVVTTIVENKGEAGISLKKLEKRVISQYLSTLPDGRPPREHKISSKLKTVLSKHFRLVNDRVFLRPDV